MVNPLVSHRSRSANLRKVKTDAADAYQLCELFYKEELPPHQKRGIQLLNLRNLTRQQAITSNASQTKLQLQSILDQVFPEYRGVFGNLYSKVSLRILEAFPTSETVFTSK
jgi:transposase